MDLIAGEKIDRAMVAECAIAYRNSYGAAPWNEEYSSDEVESCIAGFLDSEDGMETAKNGLGAR